MLSDSKGYTLLELVIGMTLTAMLMAALVIGLGVGSRAWQRGEERLQQTHSDKERLTFLVEQVTSLVPYRVQSNDPDLPGVWTILEADPFLLRFISTQGTRFRTRSGLVLVEYAIVRSSFGTVELALHETPVDDDAALLRGLVEGIGQDPDTGRRVVIYRPSWIRANDLRLMTGLRAARFDYLDPRPRPGAPLWLEAWQGRPDTPFPAAVRLRWVRGGQLEQEVFPIRAEIMPEETLTR